MMDDAKKLKDSELEQTCGGGDIRLGRHQGHVINPNGTDLYAELWLEVVKKHLEYFTEVYYDEKGPYSTRIRTENSEFGYVKNDDIY